MPLRRRQYPEFARPAPSPFRFLVAARIAPGALFGQDEIPHGATVYAVYDGPGDIPCGFVARLRAARWEAWNAYGDRWTLYHETREAAAAGMLRAGWRSFERMPGRR